MYRIFIFMVFVLLLSSCGKDQFETDLELIEAFIAENNLTNVQVTEEGIHYIIDQPGTSEKPKIDNIVTVEYTGYYLDGEIFDTTDGTDPRMFGLTGVVRGWRIAIPLFGKGGRGTIIIPSEYGYGNNPPRGVRENAVLVFDIHLIDFE